MRKRERLYNFLTLVLLHFQVSKVNTGKTNNVSADAAFKSKSKRELMDIKDIARNPAPGI